MRKYPCPVPGCDKEAEYVRFDSEEVLIPFNKTLEQMPKTRKGHIKPLGVQRNIYVECPIHGVKWFGQMGHHVSVKF
jgi:hypothetical protein